jgi:hypothetical protein
MKYIVAKRFRRKAIDGNFNIPYGTEVDVHDGFLWYDGKKVCTDHSCVMREYFVKNEDGLGLKRHKIAHDIINAMLMHEGETQEEWQKRWDILWNDNICNKYRKDNSETTFLWSIEFYNAPLLDLYHIAALAGVPVSIK